MARCLFAVVTSALAVLISMCPDAGLADSAEDKRPVPSEAEQAEPLKLLREIFGSQYAAAKTAEDREELAREILQRSAEVEDPVNRYVMLRVAKDIAVQAAAADLIVETIDRIADRYQFDAVEAKLHAMTKAARHAETETQHVRLAQQAAAAFEEAVAADRFDAAMQLVELGADAARAAERWDLTRQIVALGREIDSLAEAYQDVQDDIARLESDSLDPEANLSVGRFWCLYKGDWKRGLPLLALGSDSQLAKLAEDELSEPRLAKHQLALADGWWDLAESNEGRPQEQCRRRAALWYRAAMSGLSGIQREKAKRRLAEIGTRAEQTANPTPAPGTQPAKLADALVGMYQVLATERKGNGKGRFKLHLGADRSAAIEGQTVGSWRVEGLRAYIDFDDPDQGQGILVLGRDQLRGSQVKSQDDIWTWVLKPLRVVSTWNHRDKYGRTSRMTLWSNGRIDDPDGRSTWQLNGRTLVLKWSNGYTDTCTISSDGQRYSGRNQYGYPISGARAADAVEEP